MSEKRDEGAHDASANVAAERLRAARIDAGLSQREVANRLASMLGDSSRSSASVSAWEKRARRPPINVMAAWAEALGLQLVISLIEPSDRVPAPEQGDLAEIERRGVIAKDQPNFEAMKAQDIEVVEQRERAIRAEAALEESRRMVEHLLSSNGLRLENRR